eukprot:snap_masked-scaffold_7-processed-gene-7.19-mRNA-1 protein AED:1.00 eAED:1.00 QI:0/0/0/0/1/1/2/0/62
MNELNTRLYLAFIEKIKEMELFFALLYTQVQVLDNSTKKLIELKILITKKFSMLHNESSERT